MDCPCWDRVEFSEDLGQSFTELKELPEELAYACLVIADDTIFVAGGQRRKNLHSSHTFLIRKYHLNYFCTSQGGLSSIRNKLYKIKLGDPDWTRGEDMPVTKTKHTCSPISTQSSSKIVVVGGQTGRK